MAIYRSFQPRFAAISAAARAYSAGNGGAPRRRGQTRRTFSRGAADTDVSAAPSAPRMSSGAFMPCFLAAARLSLSRKTIVSAHSFSAAVHLAQPRGESGPSPAVQERAAAALLSLSQQCEIIDKRSAGCRVLQQIPAAEDERAGAFHSSADRRNVQIIQTVNIKPARRFPLAGARAP